MNLPYPPPMTRNLIQFFALMAAFMTQLDVTIVTVALPHMQASTSASAEQINWVLTSYIIMAAITTPLTGWLSSRFGRKRVMVVSVAGFTVVSVLCGVAANFEQLILFRLLQGVMGAALLPMSQAILLDINPPEKHGSAMALWGMGAVLGPIAGPVLGGWLTQNLNWRWVFFINIPFGVLAAIGLAAFMTETRAEKMRFDLMGFGLLALAVGSFQLMLDRGQMADWFDSREIWIEATVCVVCFYLTVVHVMTAKDPFIRPRLFRDSNYLVGSLFGIFLGGTMYSTMSLIPPLLTNLMGYPVQLVGLVSAPRGVATFLMMLLAERLANRMDSRVLILTGIAICSVSAAMMGHSSLYMDDRLVIMAGLVQGAGAGLMFVPITTTVFSTIAPEDRNEGSAMNSLIRNLAGSMWISILQTLTLRQAQVEQSRLVEGLRPDNPVMGWKFPDFDFGITRSVAQLDGEVARQAMMVAFTHSFWLMALAGLFVAPCVMLIRRTK